MNKYWNPDYNRTYSPFYKYFFPIKDYYKLGDFDGYYSEIFSNTYYDGYGYDFFYGGYGYFEYSVHTEPEEMTPVKPGDILAFTLFLVIICMFFTPVWILYTYSKEHR